MKKLSLILVVFVVGISQFHAQQDKLLTHFIFDKMSINPAATGMGMPNGICGTMIYRDQWDKFGGAPNSVLANVEANLSRYFPSAVGLSFYHDHIGFSNQNNLTLNYAYHLPLGDGFLGIGAAVGMTNYSFAPDWITPDQTPVDQDIALPTEKGQTTLDANFGVYYMSNSGWYAGISSTHLPAMRLDELNFTTARHYYAMGGYRWNNAISAAKIDLEANALIRSDIKFLSADINIRGIWNKMVYLGLTYRTIDAVAIMAGASWKNFTLGYSYDITTNRIKNISEGSHEIMLKYCYHLPPLPITRHRDPRFL